ncbi:hypothetical protein D3C71_1720160 [compost metagenome]
MMPARAAAIMLMSIAVAIIPPIFGSWNQRPAKRPISEPKIMPFSRPTPASRRMIRGAL